MPLARNFPRICALGSSRGVVILALSGFIEPEQASLILEVILGEGSSSRF